MVSEHVRLDQALRAENDLKLVAYMMGGHPNRKRSIEVGKRLATSGVAALEIGIPHSDPLADGPVIQRAGQIPWPIGNLARNSNLPYVLLNNGLPSRFRDFNRADVYPQPLYDSFTARM